MPQVPRGLLLASLLPSSPNTHHRHARLHSSLAGFIDTLSYLLEHQRVVL